MCLLLLLDQAFASTLDQSNIPDKIQNHLIKLQLIDEHYQLIMNNRDKYRSLMSESFIQDLQIYGKYHINRLRARISDMEYLTIHSGDYAIKKILEQDKLILDDSKYIMKNLIHSYNVILKRAHILSL